MKTLGIIGGIGPESTIAYYRLIIETYARQKADGSYPPVIINSIDLTKMLDMIAANELAAVTDYLVGEVKKLVRGGAAFGLLAANSPHIVFDEIQRGSPIPLISIVEATCKATMAWGITTVGLMGARFTMQGHFYTDVFAKEGIQIVVPGAEDQDYIHEKYMSELVKGVFPDETRGRLLEIVDKMKAENDIQGLILGGTELPLILRDEVYQGIPFLDTTRIHVERAVAEMLA